MNKYFFGTGRRKTSIVQVRIFDGSGKLTYKNGDEIKSVQLIESILKPFSLVSKENKYDVSVALMGGGFSSQRDAALLAVSRALSKTDPEIEKMLKKEGYLTRDSREKERKKPGLKRARRAPQWAKR